MDGGVNLFLSFILNLEAQSGVLDVRQDAFLHEFVQNVQHCQVVFFSLIKESKPLTYP